MDIRMSAGEEVLFRTFLERCGSYFEFGMGGSTVAACNTVKGRVVAIDSDVKWVESVRSKIKESTYPRNLISIDIGQTIDWGYPKDNSRRDVYKNYSRSIIEQGPSEFDLCLVDGRFRVACFMHALLRVRADCVLCIHDYRCRDNYHVVERHARIISEYENISFFVRRSNADMDAISSMAEGYEFEAI